MEITPRAAAEALVARARREQNATEARAAVIQERLPAIARLLRHSYGAVEVVLFGSLAWGGFHERSDVDIAVRGVRAELLDAAAAEASRLAGAPVELFALEQLPPDFARRVSEEGTLLP